MSPTVSIAVSIQVPGAQPQPGSMTPSQSLSLPSQTSGAGGVSPAHGPRTPPLQVLVPWRHSPTLLPQMTTWPGAQFVEAQTIPEQMVDAQSVSERHPAPNPHPGQVLPQSTSVSVPFLSPSKQLGSSQNPP